MAAQRLQIRGGSYRDVKTKQDVADMLDRLAEYGMVTLHSQRLRRTRVTIDHVAVAPSGVYVVDTLLWTGRVELREGDDDLRPNDRLLIAERDRTRLAGALVKKVGGIRRALGDYLVPVHAVLCFIDGDWPLWAKPIELRGITVMWPRELERRVVQLGKRGPDDIAAISTRLQGALRPN